MLNDCGKKNQYQGNYVYPDNHDFSSNLVLRSYSSADDHNKVIAYLRRPSGMILFLWSHTREFLTLVRFADHQSYGNLPEKKVSFPGS